MCELLKVENICVRDKDWILISISIVCKTFIEYIMILKKCQKYWLFYFSLKFKMPEGRSPFKLHVTFVVPAWCHTYVNIFTEIERVAKEYNLSFLLLYVIMFEL